MRHIDRITQLRFLCVIVIVIVISWAILFEINLILKGTAVPLLITMFVILIMPSGIRNILKQVPLPIIFLYIACILPFVYLYNPNPIVYEIPPPGYTTQWWYYLIGDFDYFFRLRFLSLSIPFWMITGFFILQMNAPNVTSYLHDFLIHLAISCVLSISWWYLSIWIFSGITSWEIVPITFTPMIGIAFVAVHRAVNWKSSDAVDLR